jgi:hypothetical protein
MVSKIFGNLINPINLSYNWAKEFDLISFSGYRSNLSFGYCFNIFGVWFIINWRRFNTNISGYCFSGYCSNVN